jgi:MFS family permease
MLLDRHSTKKLIILAMTLCTIGTYLFGIAHSLAMFLISRITIGAGGAFCFLGAFRLATRWFVPAKLSKITGIIVTMAMLGGLLGQQPAVFLIQAVGWRHTLFIDAALGVFLILLMVIIIEDAPCKLKFRQDKKHAKSMGVISSLCQVIKLGQVWLGAIYGCMLNLVIYVIGALWGLRFLTDTYHLKTLTASHISSFMLIGAIFGSPIIGAFGAHTRYKRTLMFVCALASLLAMLSLNYCPQNVYTLTLVFFALGFFTSAQVMAYPHAAHQSIPALQASATSIVSTCMLGSTAIMQPLFAWLLTKDEVMVHGRVVLHYGMAIGAMAICLAVSVVISLVIDIHNKRPRAVA